MKSIAMIAVHPSLGTDYASVRLQLKPVRRLIATAAVPTVGKLTLTPHARSTSVVDPDKKDDGPKATVVDGDNEVQLNLHRWGSKMTYTPHFQVAKRSDAKECKMAIAEGVVEVPAKLPGRNITVMLPVMSNSRAIAAGDELAIM